MPGAQRQLNSGILLAFSVQSVHTHSEHVTQSTLENPAFYQALNSGIHLAFSVQSVHTLGKHVAQSTLENPSSYQALNASSTVVFFWCSAFKVFTRTVNTLHSQLS